MSMEIFIEGPGDKKIMKGGIELLGESFSDQIFLKYYGILKKIQEGDVDREMKNIGGSYKFFFLLDSR